MNKQRLNEEEIKILKNKNKEIKRLLKNEIELNN